MRSVFEIASNFFQEKLLGGNFAPPPLPQQIEPCLRLRPVPNSIGVPNPKSLI